MIKKALGLMVGASAAALLGAAPAKAQSAPAAEPTGAVGTASGRVICPGIPSSVGECAAAASGVESAGAPERAAGAGTPVLQVEGSGRFEYDDNPLLRADAADSIFGFIATPRVSVIGETDVSRLEFGGQLEANRYDDSDFNSNDVYLNFAGQRRFRTGAASLKADFSYDTTRTSEVADSGLSIAGVRNTRFTVAPHVQSDITQVDQLILDGSVAISKYDDLDNYTNYRTYTLKPTLQHSFSETQAATFALEGVHYETTSGSGVTTDTLIPQVGWVSQFSPRWRASGSVGVQYSTTSYDLEFPGREDGSEWTHYFDVAVNYDDLNDHIAFQTSRRPSSLSSGNQAQTTQFKLTGTHNLNQRLDLKLGLTYQISDRSGSNSSGNNDITFIEAAPQLVYRLTEKLNLNLMYRHREREIGDAEATSDAVMVTLTFRPDEFRID